MPRYIVNNLYVIQDIYAVFITDCGCSEAVISPQCNESGACMCTGGAVGEKCDEYGFEYSGTNLSTVLLRCNLIPSPKSPCHKCMHRQVLAFFSSIVSLQLANEYPSLSKHQVSLMYMNDSGLLKTRRPYSQREFPYTSKSLAHEH